MELDIKNIRPTGNRILLQIRELEKTLGSGLEIADTATNNAPVIGKIIRAGEKSVFKPEQEVMFRRYSIDEIKVVTPMGDQVFYFIEDADVLAVLEEPSVPVTNTSGMSESLARVEKLKNKNKKKMTSDENVNVEAPVEEAPQGEETPKVAEQPEEENAN